ncbi:nucleoplasmin-like protein ANO39 isoform X2 [Mercenaria mercenaria]|uniref:nucleoplasmin-like protein ANO39 isoform X2 n=1 Tax=Mercenaria mercenaria TaxID=6596 RepID=UPI00234E4882|nr:nucleoplasmin-like protein ANO39 isoform X2 [Mercenaria mercenaria]
MVEAAQEHFWGVELSKEKPTFTWSFEEEEDDEDNDYLIHTLFLKNAVLGTSAVKGERNIVQIETKNFDKKDIAQPLLSLTLGQTDMCNLDISFGNEVKATFRLVEGSGPIALGGQQLVEFPPDELNSQDESALEDTMESELTEEDMSPKKSKKRKAGAGADKKSKKGKLEESMSSADDSMEDDEEDEDDDEEDEDEEDMDEEEESSPEKGKKKRGGKDQKGKKAGPKTTKVSPKKAAKKTTKKGKK